jgi:hypothetical protein
MWRGCVCVFELEMELELELELEATEIEGGLVTYLRDAIRDGSQRCHDGRQCSCF